MNPSRRKQENYHITPRCEGCKWENMSDPTERPCTECVRSQVFLEIYEEIEKGELKRCSERKSFRDYWRTR